MRKYDNYDQTEAFTGEYETLEPGAYVCKILNVVSEEKPYGDLLRISIDIDSGDHRDYYRRRYDKAVKAKPDAKWPGMYYQTIKQDDLSYFKGFITAIEESNPGYKWDWNEKSLVGKRFGGIFGQEEFRANDGSIKLSTKLRFARSLESIQKPCQIPEIKRLAKAPDQYFPEPSFGSAPAPTFDDGMSEFDIGVGGGDTLPF